jgi:hypothetical protein
VIDKLLQNLGKNSKAYVGGLGSLGAWVAANVTIDSQTHIMTVQLPESMAGWLLLGSIVGSATGLTWLVPLLDYSKEQKTQ